MSSYGKDRVVVGVDQPNRNQPAIGLAVAAARQRRAGLTIIHAFPDQTGYGQGPWYPNITDAVRDAELRLEQLGREVAEHDSDVDVQAMVVVGSAADVLIKISRHAKMIVLGCRGRGGFAELLLGSVSSQVAAHARCPVIVLRPADALGGGAEGPVLVGIDGSPASAAAVGFAFAEADGRRVPLVALHAWALTLSVRDNDYRADVERATQQAHVLVSEALAGWREKYPDVVVKEKALHEANAGKALVDASTRAGLIVVGSRGRGGFIGLALGSVSQALLHHGHCPIAVVRP